MSDGPLISTTYKAKLRQGFSYPIGSSVVSECFGCLAASKLITLRFSLTSVRSESDFQARMKNREPYSVVRIGYRNIRPGLTGSNAYLENGWFEETWNISICAVPSGEKSVVKGLLLDTGLKAAYEWIAIDRPMTWRDGRHAFNLLYDPQGMCISVSE